jgi:hypothetical protein
MSKKSVANTPDDPTLPKVPVEVNGRKYFLAFDFNGLAKAEALTGLNLLTSLDFTGLTASQFRALLFAAVSKYQPDLTLDEVGALIRPATVGKLTDALTRAFTDSSAEPETPSPNVPTPVSE